MADTQSNDRTESARRHDDHELIDDAERAPSFQGSSGGGVATDVGSRDEERGVAGATGVTRVEGKDKVQPVIPTRADNDGANG